MAAKASRLALRNTAVRAKMYARAMLSGPPGAGKTLTALEIAHELVGGDMSKVTFVDTEKDSSLTYAEGKFEGFNHLPWDPPYAPGELATNIIAAGEEEGTEVIIVDSLTHFWKKRGGTMDIADGKFGGWKTARPVQEEMVDALLGTKAHVIVCVRSKVEYAQMDDERRAGRQKVVKMGMAPQQDGDLEYEFNIAVEMDMEHTMYVGKSRTSSIPVGRIYGPGQAANFAATYADWLAGGADIEAPTIEALQVQLGMLHPEVAQRMRVLWTERGLPHIQSLSPAQVLRVIGLVDQAKQDFEKATGQSAAGAPAAPAPAPAPQQQPQAPQQAAQPPQQPQQQAAPQQQQQDFQAEVNQYEQQQREPQYAGGSMAPQQAPQDAGANALRQQQIAQARQHFGMQPAVIDPNEQQYFQQ